MQTKTKTIVALGITIQVVLPFNAPKNLFEKIKTEAERVEQRFSRFRSSSDLSKLNKNLGIWSALDEEFLYLINENHVLHGLTKGWLNIGLGSVLSYWGYDESYDLKPEVQPKRFTSLKIEQRDTEIKINTPIDFGAFGKGYFLDRCLKICEAAEVNHYLINAGGDMIFSAPESQTPWRLFFEDPRVKNRVIGEVFRRTGVFCSSSALQRRWGEFHHLVDPYTQEPSKHMLAVYVQMPTMGLVADALSTALFVMGFYEAKKLFPVLQKKYRGLAIMLISHEGVMWRSDNFVGKIYTL